MYKLRKLAERNRRLSLERDNALKKAKAKSKKNSNGLNNLQPGTPQSETLNRISNGVTLQVKDNNCDNRKELAENSSNHAKSLRLFDNIVDVDSSVTKDTNIRSLGKPNYTKKFSEGSSQYVFQMGPKDSDLDSSSQLAKFSPILDESCKSVDRINTSLPILDHSSNKKLSNKRSFSTGVKEIANGRTLPSKVMRKDSNEVSKDVNCGSEPKQSQITFREALKSIALEEQLFSLDNPRPLVPTAEITSPTSESSTLTILEPPCKSRTPFVLNASVRGRKRGRIVNGEVNKPNCNKIEVDKTASNYFKEGDGKNAQSTNLSLIQIPKKSESVKMMVSQIHKEKEMRKSQKRGRNSSLNKGLIHIETKELRRRIHQEICNGNTKLKRIKRKDLESLVIELFVDKVLYEHDLGQQKDLCKRLEATLESNQKKVNQFHKEVNDLKKVVRRLQSEYAVRKNQILAPVWVKRSVGIQVSPALIRKGIMEASTDTDDRIPSPSIMSCTDADCTIEKKKVSQPDPLISTNHNTPTISSTKTICQNSFKGFNYSSHQSKAVSLQNLVKTHTFASEGSLSTSQINLSTSKANLSTSKANLSTSKVNLSTSKANLSTSKANLSTSKVNLSTSKANLSTSKANLSTSKANLSTSKANLSTSKVNLSTSKANLSTSKAKLSISQANLSTSQVNLSTSKAKLSISKANLSTSKANFSSASSGTLSTQMVVAKPVVGQPSMQSGAFRSQVIPASTTQLVQAPLPSLTSPSVPSPLQLRVESSKAMGTSNIVDLTEEDEGNRASSAAVPIITFQKPHDVVDLSRNSPGLILAQNPPPSVGQSAGIPSPGPAGAPLVVGSMATHQLNNGSTRGSGRSLHRSSPTAMARVNGNPSNSPLSRHPAPLPNAPLKQISGYSRKLPPTPILRLSQKEKSIVLTWNMTRTEEEHERIASYQLFAYQEGVGPATTSLWKKVGSVKALALPMTCTLTQFLSGHVYHFAVRAVDVRNRLGPFSVPRGVFLRKQFP